MDWRLRKFLELSPFWFFLAVLLLTALLAIALPSIGRWLHHP